MLRGEGQQAGRMGNVRWSHCKQEHPEWTHTGDVKERQEEEGVSLVAMEAGEPAYCFLGF